MLPETVTSLLGGGTAEVVRECRRCGTSVGAGEACPHCGPETDVVEYVIE